MKTMKTRYCLVVWSERFQTHRHGPIAEADEAEQAAGRTGYPIVSYSCLLPGVPLGTAYVPEEAPHA